ncbi:DEAD box-containing helicase-like transcription factor/DNA repair protein [Aspergillus campestris IBT 28561]|uniref:DEAD box-containing helicase-like transcription factor/DNA repair protein n=1 Tax=Aspergillus campestris (strain IBT 28561) TaxID=1392248 RepID=A0A2I1D2F5_ASPC2|nr:DEAD box-containing helicase-like transcription factor/DNA repair protein [Aspergillus campestris IBT 28561]PKY04018.1 DEAD box-containing helicase-like transcription factor/DNA repair protein [Aspergillus campestris IBT 28561]
MAVVNARIAHLGADVLNNLAAAFLRHEEFSNSEPPGKRRKTAAAPRSLRDSTHTPLGSVPSGYIPLARFSLYLDFAHTVSLPPGFESPIAVSIEVAESSHGATPNSHRIGSRQISSDCFKLQLATVSTKEVILDITSSDPELVKFGENLELARGLPCGDRYGTKVPAACYVSTLFYLPENSYFRLETTLLWKDSLEILQQRRLTQEHYRVFCKYALQGDDTTPIGGSQSRNRKSSESSWSPHDFYQNVYVPPITPQSSEEIKCHMIECQLFPFQRRAVRWLLQREGMALQSDGRVLPSRRPLNGSLPTSFQTFTDADGRVCFSSHLFLVATTDLHNWYDAGEYLKGGILAEEMGLGKTVEMISLICLNKRPLSSDMGLNGSNGGLEPSGATLIITPPAILEQWEQEIRSHAPGLRVTHYEGIQRHKTMSNQELVNFLVDHDVVLTTYNVLAREVHYSGDAPKRDLRHEKRFEPRKSPLVQISWWRVCLDEAQMIETGVSNAAKVARLIPCQNAWAVTGTPLRRDITDLLGLLLFLHYEPFCGVWNRLCHFFKPTLAQIVHSTAIRHNKDNVRDELRLPPQKRIVLTVPFTAVEEQRYGQLFEQMCEECGLDYTGAPVTDDWNPDDFSVIEKMRSWLARLRQTCLHPGGNHRRGLGTGGPLRSVNEVLEVMIDQTDSLAQAEERTLLLSQARRGQLLENALHRQEALDVWTKSLERANAIVEECRERLNSECAKNGIRTPKVDDDSASAEISDNEGNEMEKNTRVGTYRQRLRFALDVQHTCVFFTANAYYQIKTDPNLTTPDTEKFKSLEKSEMEAYETAKLIRKEMLADVSRKASRYMRKIREKQKTQQFVKIPKMNPELYSSGLESRRVLDRFEDFCEALNGHAVQYDMWRQIMIKLLSRSLIDQEDDSELEGDEYEKSTKLQDEMYVYMEALRAMFADRNDALTGQKNTLIAHEVKMGIIQAQKGEGPSPKLYLETMNARSDIKPEPQLGSLRGIISELRSLTTSLEWQANEGSSRARAELGLVTLVLKHASNMASEQTKAALNLSKEVEMFRDTMNHRLEYYRQLQRISDTVAPYDEESVGKPLNEAVFAAQLEQERITAEKVSSLKAKLRYLLHLRDESGSDESSRICIICQSGFEIGVLTVCGHKYCKECLQLWWSRSRTCPTCKKRLKANDFHQITYKPQEFVAEEEKAPMKMGSERLRKNSIYTDISSGTLSEIKNIDLDSSFGTKIDTLARHILWLREHDPGSKSVVFSQYRYFLGILGSAFKKFQIGYSTFDNKDGIHMFKTDPSVECFLLHAEAQSSGLNLVNATHVFLCEPLVNTAIELQAIARVHRIGQRRPTTVWMYLVSDTVEQSIYELSVSRRQDHIIQKERQRESHSTMSQQDDKALEKHVTDSTVSSTDGTDKDIAVTEVAIDSANSSEIQDAPLSKLIAGGSGGEIVKKDDLWQCLFGRTSKTKEALYGSDNAHREVARFLRGEAAESRRTDPTPP